MQHPLESNRSVAALLQANSFRRTLPLRSAPRHWAQGPTIAISREVGAGGATVARAVGARLDWRVYDHEILDRVAEDMHVRVGSLETLDERGAMWLQEWLQSLGGEHRVNACSFSQHLIHALFTLAQPGHCIIVGRGAAQVLPGTTTLRVRLVAALKDRVHCIAQQLGLAPAMAKHYIDRKEQQRIRFVKDHFHCDPTDPLQYDLTLNTSRFSVEQCTDLIVSALHTWYRQTEDEELEASAEQPQEAAGIMK
jgi:cytidylate kinase